MDIPIPRLPTDNLYKFVALSGVLLVIVGYSGMAFSAVRSSELARPVLWEQTERLARMRVVQAQLERATKAYKQRDLLRANSVNDSANRLNDSLHRTEPLANELATEFADERDLMKDLNVVGAVIGIIGSFCGIWGFSAW